MRSRGMLNKRPNTTAKGKRILIAFHAQKYKILSTGIPNSAITIPRTPLSIANTISTPKKPKTIGRKRLIS